MKIGRMNKENIYRIEYKNGKTIDTFYLYHLIIKIVSELGKTSKSQLREVMQLQKAIISIADETFFKLKKWIEEVRQTEA